MRRRERLPASGDGPPLPLLVGCCLEVWAADPDDPRAVYSARRRLSEAREAWAASSGLSAAEATRALNPRGAPYSALMAPGRLERHGLTLDDVPALRAAAVKLLAAAGDRAGGRGARRPA